MTSDSSPGTKKTYPIPPDPMSVPCGAFARDMRKLLSFMIFVPALASSMDQVARTAANALSSLSPESKDFGRVVQSGAGVLSHFGKHKPLLDQMFFCRAVDNFLTYISELLTLIFTVRPETLRSSAQVRLDYILQFDSMPDLLNSLVERRVNELSYQGMEELANELRDRVGLQVFRDDALRQTAVRLIETRNIIVHNRGIINRHFIRRVPEAAAELGRSVALTGLAIFDDIYDLAGVAFDLDRTSVKKFSLATPVTIDSVLDED